jgi:hypothetical protein
MSLIVTCVHINFRCWTRRNIYRFWLTWWNIWTDVWWSYWMACTLKLLCFIPAWVSKYSECWRILILQALETVLWQLWSTSDLKLLIVYLSCCLPEYAYMSSKFSIFLGLRFKELFYCFPYLIRKSLYHFVCIARVPLVTLISWWIFMKLGMSIMPLESCNFYHHDGHVNMKFC